MAFCTVTITWIHSHPANVFVVSGQTRALVADATDMSRILPRGAGTAPETWWRWYAGVGLLLLAVMAALPGTLLRELLYVLVSASVVGAILLGVRSFRPSARAPWLLMATGQSLWALADAILSWNVNVRGVDAFPAFPDVLYLIGYGLLGSAVIGLVRARSDRPLGVGATLDTATVTFGLGLLTWVFLAHPVLEADAQSAWATAFSIGYVLADIVLLAALTLLVLTSGAGSAAVRLLLLALVLLIGADFLSATLENYTYGWSPWVEMLWPASYVAWGAAALHPSMAAITSSTEERTEPAPWLRVVAMTLATLVAPGILIVQQLSGGVMDVWLVAVSSAVMFLLVMLRMDLAILETARVSGQRAILQEELKHQAEHDALTRLPNRVRTLALVQEAVDRLADSESTGRDRDRVAVLFLDLDGFKAVNDTHGHHAGDQVLRTVAARLRRLVRAGDAPTRLGGDEFVVVLTAITDPGAALSIAQRLILSVSQPIPLDGGHHVRVGTSIGIAFATDTSTTAEELLHQADLALYRAKHEGRGRTVVFGPELHDEVMAKASLGLALAQAVDNDELVLHYQPVLEVSGGRIQGFEALVRWDRPGHGLCSPGDFLPVAQSSDLICRIDAWVLRTATAQLATMRRRLDRDDLFVAVNVSGRHLSRPRFCADVLNAIADANIEPGALVLEVSEKLLMEHPTAVAHLEELRQLGVSVSLDDFGRGYSALGLLDRLPITMVKISGDCLDPSSPTTRRMLELMVTAAHGAGLPVIGERVERPEQLRALREAQCESAQGFYLGGPQSGEDLLELLSQEPQPPTAAGAHPDEGSAVLGSAAQEAC